jgi:pimeloyl-ACP methyl ester carboxylesterase
MNSYAAESPLARTISATLAAILIANQAQATDAAEGYDRITERVTFRHGDDRLEGVVFRPGGAGRHPGIVLITGSGANDRNYHGVGLALGNYFADEGFYCLTWDKPGVGESTGDFNRQTFDDRAGEALAAIHLLRQHEGVDERWVGAWGHSQGGFVAPVAAALSKEVAFVIVVGGWQGPAWQQDAIRVEQELRAKGFAEAEINEAVSFSRRRMEMIRGRATFEELDRAQEAVGALPWFGSVHRCDRVLFESARRMINFDNSASWGKVTCPVLAVYGGQDVSSGPPEPLLAVIRQGLAKCGNDDLTVKVFPDANHDLCRPRSDARQENGRLPQQRVSAQAPDFAPGYLETMSTWLSQHYERGVQTE